MRTVLARAIVVLLALTAVGCAKGTDNSPTPATCENPELVVQNDDPVTIWLDSYTFKIPGGSEYAAIQSPPVTCILQAPEGVVSGEISETAQPPAPPSGATQLDGYEWLNPSGGRNQFTWAQVTPPGLAAQAWKFQPTPGDKTERIVSVVGLDSNNDDVPDPGQPVLVINLKCPPAQVAAGAHQRLSFQIANSVRLR